MECNKDEAVKAKEIAEQKLTEKDIAGAQKFALKARNLFPALDGLSQFLEVINVYVAHEKKINGEVDFYGILSVEPSADDETIRKHYRRLALALHPDKNQSVGADGAFKMLSEAWSLLSDRTKKRVYDNRRSLRHPVRDLSMQGNQHRFRTNPASSRQPTNSNFQPTPVAPQPPKPDTFWTYCNRCQIKYEYLKLYVSKSLMCPNCHRPFLAREVAAPMNSHASAFPWSSRQQHQGTNYPTPSNSGFGLTVRANIQQDQAFKTRGANGTQPYAPTATQAAHPGQPAGGNLKRAHAEAAMSALNQEALLKKKRRIDELKPKVQRKGMGISQANELPKSSRELTNSEIRNMLVKKARGEIIKKIEEWSTAAASRTSYEEKKEVEKMKPTAPEVIRNDPRRDKIANDAVVDPKILCEQKESPVEVKSMIVPDPDFHNFDKDRTEKSFDNNEVWAAYDNDDGMPRYYALIHNVLSKKPFKVEFSWLNSKNNSELGPMNWIGSGFLKTSGDFRIGKHETNKTLNSFSHKVKWVKGARGVIQIFPRKGDVWALYRHWSPNWNELTPDDLIQKYDMVEVLGDYSEKEGVTVAPLVKVADFTSVFRQHLDLKHIRHIPREEMFRFSHQVPSYLLTGQEAPNAPAGCWELDPAALPLELLRVMTDAEIDAHRKATDTSDSERTGSESKEREKSYVVGDNNVTKPIVTYTRKKKAKTSTVDAKKETSSVAA